jgi:predicted anti-sigma-YlaC factor YlaD
MKLRITVVCLVALLLSGCSVKRFAVNKLGDSLAKSGTTYAADDDLELVGQALPFSLKLIEGLLEESPRHGGLLFAASSGFTQYAYVYVQEPADEIENTDLSQSSALRQRARNLYWRAQRYGMRAIEARHPGFEYKLRTDPRAARSLGQKDLPAAYWTGISWLAAISLSKDKPVRVAEQPLADALITRVAEIDPDFDGGGLQEFLIAYEPARPSAAGDFQRRCQQHFDRALSLRGGNAAAPYVALAEAVAIPKQQREHFEQLLRKAIAVDVDAKPEWRLANLVAQRRARWLLAHTDDLFAPPLSDNAANTSHEEAR